MNLQETSKRRDFLKSTAASAGFVMSSATALGSQASSALSVGLAGCGNRGMYDSGIVAKNEFAKVSAICDIYDDKLAAGAQKYSGAKRHKKIEEMLATGIDAVLIATPAVFHPEHFEMAVKAKKHIYLEKPAGVDAKGCRRVTAAAKSADKTKRISMGFQQRYGTDYRKAWDLVKSGEIGQIKMIRASWLGTSPPIKSGHPASEEKIRNWYFYRDMSGDMLIEQDCHNIDVIHWFTEMLPVKAAGYGSRMVRTQIGDVLDNLAFTFHYANGLVCSYSANQFGRGVGYQDVSETFLCEKGSVRTSRQGITVYREGKPPEEWPTKYDITQDALNQFIDGARNGKMENAALWGADSTLSAIMAREAIYSGREMTWERIGKT